MGQNTSAEAPTLHGPGLLLRSWQLVDAPQVYEACQDSEIQRWTTVPSPYSVSDADGFVSSAGQRWAAGLASFGIFAEDGARLLGSIGFVAAPIPGVLEIGYWVAPSARGCGVAQKSVVLLCSWAFTDPAIHRIEWMAYVGNDSSRRVAELCGFQFEGLLRGRAVNRGQPTDVWIAGLLRSDLAS
jgi:RimJ/RimL family protein N-acetyltransferase